MKSFDFYDNSIFLLNLFFSKWEDRKINKILGGKLMSLLDWIIVCVLCLIVLGDTVYWAVYWLKEIRSNKQVTFICMFLLYLGCGILALLAIINPVISMINQ